MNNYDITTAIIFFIILISFSIPLGRYMARVYTGERTFMSPVIRPLERLIYRLCGVDETDEMSWKKYALAFLAFNIIGIVLLMLIQMIQGFLPLNPQNSRVYAGIRLSIPPSHSSQTRTGNPTAANRL